jgi:replicative DNA helicase
MSIPAQAPEVSTRYTEDAPEPWEDDHQQEARTFDRRPPSDEEAEQSVLGGMLLSKDAISDVVGILGKPRPKVFYKPAHEIIYAVIFEMWADGRPADPITVGAEITQRGQASRIGGVGYLHTLVQTVPTAANAAYYAEIVLERAKRRNAIEVGTRIVQHGYADDIDTDTLIDRGLAEMQDLTTATMEAPKLSVADRWQGFLDDLERGPDESIIDSPYKDLNEILSVQAGDVVTIGAETSGGKSLVALQWGAHVAMKLGKPTLVFSMEMNARVLMARLTACTAKVDLGRLIRRELTEDDWQKIARVSDQMANTHNFILEDDGSVTLNTIRARARWMASQGMPVGLIVVDYLQLMEAEGSSYKGNRTQEVADISRGLKRLAMDFDVPVISLAQFNREAKERKPQVTDFKESSSIEQDSSAILLMYSERDENGEIIAPDEVTMIVAKNRNGVRGREIQLIKRAHYARLDNYMARA